MIPCAAQACKYVPLAWQRSVEASSVPELIGQRKHVGWPGDQNENFIDDKLESQAKLGDPMEVLVELSTCLTLEEIEELFAKFGRSTYLGSIVSVISLRDVDPSQLNGLAALSEVALVTGLPVYRPASGLSTRAVGADTVHTMGFTGEHLIGGVRMTIAIVDQGAFEDHEMLSGKESASHSELAASVGPDRHGTAMAAIAVGKRIADKTCRDDVTGQGALECTGVAPGAHYVDVEVCGDHICQYLHVMGGLEWVLDNAQTHRIKVVNLSFTSIDDVQTLAGCQDANGEDSLSELVNYLVATGITVVAAHGNNNNCTEDLSTPPPGAASLAITVGGSNDMGTVSRIGDSVFQGALTGPRSDYDPTEIPVDLLALKPDLSAPAGGVASMHGIKSAIFDPMDPANNASYFFEDGTSQAAAHVSGAAALVIQQRPDIDPASLKDLLIRLADDTNTTAGGFSEPVASYGKQWDMSMGWGILDIDAALGAASSFDPRIRNCDDSATPNPPGRPCPLLNGVPHYANENDIELAIDPPVENTINTVTAHIENDSSQPVDVLVNFGVYQFGVNGRRFHHIGSKFESIPAGAMDHQVSIPWEPNESGHQCLQINIAYGPDADFTNNTTQRNVTVATGASSMTTSMLVENPFVRPASIVIEPKPSDKNWRCVARPQKFDLPAFFYHPREVEIELIAPNGAKPGDSAQCDVTVHSTAQGGEDPFDDPWIDGVVVYGRVE